MNKYVVEIACSYGLTKKQQKQRYSNLKVSDYMFHLLKAKGILRVFRPAKMLTVSV